MDDCWVYLEESSEMPPDAVIGGHEADGSLQYVGRVRHEGAKFPAKVLPNHRAAYIGLDGKEHKKRQYEVLTGANYKWVPVKDGSVPQNSVIGGYDNQNHTMFIGRGVFQKALSIGRINPHARVLFIAHEKEHSVATYEALTYSVDQGCKKSSSFTSTWVPASGSCIPENAVLLDEDTFIYVGRAFHKGVLLPALVTPDKACAYVFTAEGKIEKFKFEVLTSDNYRWETAEIGNIAPGVVEGSYTVIDEPLYIGRTRHLGFTALGQVQQSDGCMYITVDGKKVEVKTYEILVCRGKEKSSVDCDSKSNE